MAGRARPQPCLHLASVKPYVWTFLPIALVTAVGKLISPFFDIANVTLLYLLPVLVSAVRWGRAPSLFASFLGVLAFDFFFVPPVFTFAVADIKYLFTFAVFLLVGMVTGAMATRIRDELEKTRQREKRTLALYALSEKIASKADLGDILATFARTVAEAVDGQVSILAGEGDHASGSSRPIPRAPASGTKKKWRSSAGCWSTARARAGARKPSGRRASSSFPSKPTKRRLPPFASISARREGPSPRRRGSLSRPSQTLPPSRLSGSGSRKRPSRCSGSPSRKNCTRPCSIPSPTTSGRRWPRLRGR